MFCSLIACSLPIDIIEIIANCMTLQVELAEMHGTFDDMSVCARVQAHTNTNCVENDRQTSLMARPNSRWNRQRNISLAYGLSYVNGELAAHLRAPCAQILQSVTKYRGTQLTITCRTHYRANWLARTRYKACAWNYCRKRIYASTFTAEQP